MPRDLSNLTPAKGSVRKNMRRGRGAASGKGGHTTGRGHKGAQSRSGYKRRAWFEGGQMPIQRRQPKRGFTNIFREEYQVINVSDLKRIVDVTEIIPEVLVQFGLVKSVSKPIKLLANGETDKVYTISISAVSEQARKKIEATGGQVNVPPPALKRRGKYKKKSQRAIEVEQ